MSCMWQLRFCMSVKSNQRHYYWPSDLTLSSMITKILQIV